VTFCVLIFDVSRVFHVLVNKYMAGLESMKQLRPAVIASEVNT